LNQNSYRNLITGTGCGPCKRLLRFLLFLLSIVYALTIRLRNFCYDRGMLKTYPADVPVISVGNITTGGTGKTPLVIWLYNILQQKGLKCAILTRGYKSGQGKLTDEPAILAKSCPGANVIVNPDRVAGTAKAVGQFGADVIVMDDGFQHRRLQRDLDIIAIDATCPFGYGRLLPGGLLREPIGSIGRADAAVITRYDQADDDSIAETKRQIEQITRDIAVAKAIHKHPCVKAIKDEPISIEQLRGKTIYVFCGIGNPEAFLQRLKEFGPNIAGSRIYNDHHDYTQQDISDIYEEARYLNAEMILSTEKDWIKTALLWQKDENILFAYLAVELEFVSGADTIEALVDKVVSR
jgi:tetraacyldisaccharide 4'-kinase